MLTEKKINVIVAETCPVISFGIVQVIKKLGFNNMDIVEISGISVLNNLVKRKKIDILFVNPTFNGMFNPIHLRENSINSEIKIVALEIGKLSKQAADLYNAAINITDDLETINNTISKLKGDKTSEIVQEKESLSNREKEIISLVVKGLTNQEIADKLFLSVHTVITHRRNIARKLEIHSATGLTIYAIVNKIVKLEDVVSNL